MTEITMVGVALTFLAILAGMFFNNRRLVELRIELRDDLLSLKGDVLSLKSDIGIRFEKVENRLDRIEIRLDKMNVDMGQFYHLTGKLEGRVDSLESRK